MWLGHLVSGLLLNPLVSAIPSAELKRAASILPLSTKGRDVIDVNGNVFNYKSTNWPGKYFEVRTARDT
jgi:endoglucanase